MLNKLLYSDTAIRLGVSNEPTPEHLENLNFTILKIKVIEGLLGHPIVISSGYRNPVVNKAVGGSPTSSHALGLAVDFICPGYGSVWDVFLVLAKSNMLFDQLIYEKVGGKEWIHIGFDPRGRQQVMLYDGMRYTFYVG